MCGLWLAVEDAGAGKQQASGLIACGDNLSKGVRQWKSIAVVEMKRKGSTLEEASLASSCSARAPRNKTRGRR